MSKDKMGLVFLSSQPRSGSTLTQKILGAHPSVYTRSEPWIMLYPAYRLKNNLAPAEYNSWLGNKAFQNFLSELPDGRKAYTEALADMYTELYHSYLEAQGKTLFLDKTPRYYLIVNELHEIFPDAKQVLLLRNPLSVLRSIINSWTKDDHARLIEYKVDFYKAITIFDGLVQEQPSWLYIMHYESLLKNPEEQLSSLCSYLEIEYDPQMLDYHQKPQEKWEFGDPENVYAKKGIDAKNITMEWLGKIDDPQKWRLFYDYLNFVGRERYGRLGYDFETDMQYLETNIPAENLEVLLNTTQSFDSFLNPSTDSMEKSLTEAQSLLKQKNKKIESLLQENEVLKKSSHALLTELQEIKGSKKYRLVLRLGKLKALLNRK